MCVHQALLADPTGVQAQAGGAGRTRRKHRPDTRPAPPGKAPGNLSAADARTAALARTTARQAALLELQRLAEASGGARAAPPKPFLVALSDAAQARTSTLLWQLQASCQGC